MFENLSDRLSHTLRTLTGKAKLSEDNIQDALRDVRKALLEADVALPVVKDFIERVKMRAVGQEVSKSLSPGQQFIKIVQDELTHVMGDANESLNLATTPPAVILMAGLQGAGKTTSVAKLARHLKEREKKKVMVASADIYRPAAIKQLETLAHDVGALFCPSSTDQKPVDIARNAIDAARKQFADVLILDTAGRLHIDTALMDEIKQLHAAVNPVETLFVIDAMIGQDAVNTAKAFNDALPLTGVILTKADGDARGGAALSVRHVTGKPIKFIGVGEKTDALEPFHPERIASRILGMGDVLSLIEQVEQKVDKEKAEKLAKKIARGKFDLDDYAKQLRQITKMGSVQSLISMLPGAGKLAQQIENANIDKTLLRRQAAIISSMTPQERRNPDILKASRKRRIAAGSGTTAQDVNRLLKQFDDMSTMMKRVNKLGHKGLARACLGALLSGRR